MIALLGSTGIAPIIIALLLMVGCDDCSWRIRKTDKGYAAEWWIGIWQVETTFRSQEEAQWFVDVQKHHCKEMK